MDSCLRRNDGKGAGMKGLSSSLHVVSREPGVGVSRRVGQGVDIDNGFLPLQERRLGAGKTGRLSSSLHVVSRDPDVGVSRRAEPGSRSCDNK